MNILLLHSSSDLYGASKILLTTVKLLRNDFQITVVLSEEGPLAIALREEEIDVVIIRLGILRRKYFNPTGLLNRLLVLKNAKEALTKVVIEKKINIIYSNTAAVLIGVLVAKSCNIKHIWHIHEIIPKPIWLSKFIGFLLNNFSDKVVVVSDAVNNHWKPLIKNKEKLVTIYNGIDYNPYLESIPTLRDELGIKDGILLIGMVGRVHFWKGQKYFLELVSLINEKFENVRFVMVGDAFPGYEYLYDELSIQKKDLNIENVVYDLGFRTDIPQILKSFDLFISPSILPDPLPTVILEAMASGVPVIATNHGGSVEMVSNGRTGVLIPWDNAQKAFEFFKPLIENKEQRSLMGIEGQKRVLEHFSINSFKENMRKILKSLD